MADFSDFEGHAAGTTEEDPVADFMARQKEQLEGIDDDLAFSEFAMTSMQICSFCV